MSKTKAGPISAEGDLPSINSYADRLVGLTDRRLALDQELNDIAADIAREIGWLPVKTYFIAADGTDLIKIGKAFDVEARLRSLQTGSPVTLRLLRVIPFNCEKRAHAIFAKRRHHGEWFQYDPAMLTLSFTRDLLTEARSRLEAA